MKSTIGSFGSLVLVACAAQPPTTAASAPAPGAEALLVGLHQRTVAAMEAGDAASANNLYDADALMVLTNGKVHRGAENISKVIAGAPALKFRDARFDDVETVVLKNGAYVRARFTFAMTLPGGQTIRPSGRRLTLWRPGAGGWTVKVDVWVPDRPGPKAEIGDALAKRIAALEEAYNAHDQAGAKALFAPEAVFALSDATVFEGPNVEDMLSFAFGAGLRNMHLNRLRMVDSGEAVIVASNFGLELGAQGSSAKKIEGCRLDVWTRGEDGWRLLVELAQPLDTAGCKTAS